MPETVVPYARFLEIRQRRRRVAADLASPPGSKPNGDSRDAGLPTIDCEAVIDDDRGVREQKAAVVRQTKPLA